MSKTLNHYFILARGLIFVASISGCAVWNGLQAQDTETLADNQETPQQIMARGDAAFASRANEQALDEYVNALNLEPKNPEVLYKVGIIHFDLGHFDLAQDALQLARQLSPNNPNITEALGLAALETQHYSVAENYFNATIKADTKHWRAYNGLGLIADRQKHHDEALEYYNKALQQVGESALVFNNRGYSNYLAGNWSNAEQDYLHALKIEPKFDRARYNLGLLEARQGREAEALATFNTYLDAASAYNNLGYIYMLEANYPEAEKFLQRAISLSPTYNELAFKNLARLHQLWQFMDHP